MNPKEKASLSLSVDAFIRSIAVNKNSPHVLFLGAGASVSSGVPTAYNCIWDWKKRIFLSKNPGLDARFFDVSLSSSRQKIQQWLDAEGCYPTFDSPAEYSFYAENCFPIPTDRSQFFAELTQRAKPHVGYQLLCLLAEAEIIKAVWTTNFDNLVSRAASATNIVPIEIALDTAGRVIRQPRSRELIYVALHGDYRYGELKNTDEELKTQDETLRKGLISYAENATLIVSGYSGRDQSVMDALMKAYSNTGAGRLFWCDREQDEPNSVVKELLLQARANGREAFHISTSGFDDLLIRLADACLERDFLDRAKTIRSQFVSVEDSFPPFSVDARGITGLIKSNAFAISCPNEIFYFKSNHFKQKGGWKSVKEHIANRSIVAGAFKDGVLAFGSLADIKEVFAGKIDGEIKRTPIDEKELGYTDGVIISLLVEAIVRVFAKVKGFNSDKKKKIWLKTSNQSLRVSGVQCRIYEAASIFLRRSAGNQFLVIKPTIKATSVDGQDLPDDVEREVKRLLLTKQYNREFNAAVDGWRTRILDNNQPTNFEFPGGFKFTLRHVPALATVSGMGSVIELADNVKKSVMYTGRIYSEPSLLFSDSQGSITIQDINPLRGVVNNYPYDYRLTRQGAQEEVKLGVVCPEIDSARLYQYLNGLHQKRPATTNPEYILEYPGFSSAFHLPLSVPLPQSNNWAMCPEPTGKCSGLDDVKAVSTNIINCINAITAASKINVIVIYVPKRWADWRCYEGEDEHFDLHDFIKAFCVQKGIATQFIEESTLGKTNQCEIQWWLALSFYVKSMRTPWVLDGLDKSTAFMGIGYSVDEGARRGNHIILGCSHIYNAEGIGLKYKLSKIEEPIIRQGNPYMSKPDARRLGEGVRQLFFESAHSLPDRVVIHKRTPFLRDEKEGLLEGLSGISNIDMLEVCIEPALRYVSSKFKDGAFQQDGFPVRRGTAVVLERRKALVWVHGTTQATNNPRLSYYQGKSRIPAPLMVVRHHGTSSLSQLVKELLGFSKMNWNTFDFYTKLPATIQSSNAIAKIGSLLERFGSEPYDYRLFI